MTQSLSQDGSRTNPSSPSLGTVAPERRGLQRTSVSNGSSGTSTARSQSQPARQQAQQQQIPTQGQPTPMLPFLCYDSSGQPRFAAPGSDLGAQFGYAAASGQISVPVDARAQEFMNYYIDQRAQQGSMPPPSADMNIGRNNSHPELSRRREKSQHDLQPLALGSNSKSSRSPSPGHSRTVSTPLRSAPLLPVPRFGQPFSAVEAVQSPSFILPTSNQSNMTNGLLIVNGSYTPSSTAAESSRTYPATSPDEMPSALPGSTDSPAHDKATASTSSFNPTFIPQEYHPSSYEMENFASNFASGLSLQNIPTDSNGAAASYGSPKQSFPAYVEQPFVPMSPLATQEEESVMSPTRSNQSPWQTFSPHGANTPSSGSKEAKDASKSPGSKSLPLLSPLIETRTPSPSVARKIENWHPLIVNDNMANGESINEKPVRAPEPVPPTPLLRTNSASNVTATSSSLRQQQQSPQQQRNPLQLGANSANNQWQTNDGKKKTNRKRARSGPVKAQQQDGIGSNNNRGGQPLPAKPEDRKGG
jgi:hypothetical protein